MRSAPSLTIVLPVLLILSAGGCAGAAMEAMNDAYKALEAARAAEAERYAPESLSIAQTNYDLAHEHFLKGTRRDNDMAKVLARQAAREARYAIRESRSAASDEESRRRTSYEREQRKKLEARKIEENPDLAAKRYLALAQRRIRVASLSKVGPHPPPGVVEIEVWIAPNGQLTQIMIIQGNPDELLTRTVLHSLQDFKLDPFPSSVNQQYLKLRIKIDTRGEGAR